MHEMTIIDKGKLSNILEEWEVLSHNGSAVEMSRLFQVGMDL